MKYIDAVTQFQGAETQYGFEKTLTSADIMCLENGVEMTTNVVAVALDKMRFECAKIDYFELIPCPAGDFKIPMYKV